MKKIIGAFLLLVCGFIAGLLVERFVLTRSLDAAEYDKAAVKITHALENDQFFQALCTLIQKSKSETITLIDQWIKLSKLSPLQLQDLKSCIIEFAGICERLNKLIQHTELPSDLKKIYVEMVWEISEGSIYIPAKERDKALRKLAYQNSKYFAVLREISALQTKWQKLIDNLTAHMSALSEQDKARLQTITLDYFNALKKYIYILTPLHEPFLYVDQYYGTPATWLPFLIAIEGQLKLTVDHWSNKVMSFLSSCIKDLSRTVVTTIDKNLGSVPANAK